jgi:large subunit ribosomal protein L29
MKAEKMRGMDAAELQRNSLDAQEQLFRLRFQMGMGSTEGLKKYRNLRKDRARMLTVLNEKTPNNKAKNGETATVAAQPPKKAAPAAKAAAADKKKKK